MVEIIPKQPERQPLLVQAFFAVSILALIAALGGFFLFWVLEQKSEAEAESLKALLTAEKTPEQVVLEQKVFSSKERLEDFAKLLAKRTSALFPFLLLEEVVHPDVVFNSAEFTSSTQSMRLSGQAVSFVVLEEQLNLFDQQGQGAEASLATLKLGQEGGVDFQVQVRFPADFEIAPPKEEQEPVQEL